MKKNKIHEPKIFSILIIWSYNSEKKNMTEDGDVIIR